MEKILITGGAGFIGSNLAEELLKRGYSIRILDNLSTGKIENIKPILKDIEFIKGDTRDETIVKKVLKNIQMVFHFAAISSTYYSVKFPAETINVNVNGTVNLLEKSVEAEIDKFIYSSSAAVYSNNNLPLIEDQPLNPLSLYGVSKVIGEKFLKIYYKTHNLRTISLRLFNVYGPRQNFQSKYSNVIPKFISSFILNKKPGIFGDGKQTRDFVFIKDVVNASILALNKKLESYGECFNIGSGKEISIIELFHKIKKIIGKDIEPEFKKQRFNEVKYSCAIIDKASKMLGFKPEFSLDEGLKEMIEWFQTVYS